MWDQITQVALIKDCHLGQRDFSVSNPGHANMMVTQVFNDKIKINKPAEEVPME